MWIKTGNDTGFALDTRGARTAEKLIARLVKAPKFPELAKAIADGAYYSRYEVWQDMSDGTAKDIAHELFESGSLAALGKISDLVDDGEGNEPETRADEVMDDSSEFQDLVETLAEHLGIDDSEDLANDLKEVLRAGVAEAMEAADDSKEADIVPSHQRVEIVHYFGMGDLAPDDRYIQHVSNVFTPGTAIPDERLAAFFEGLNVDFEGFRAHVLAEQGVDLKGGPGDEALVAWLTDADYIGDRGYARQRAVERAGQWQAFAPGHDAEAPALLSHKDAWTVLTEATGSGVPCFVTRAPLDKLLSLDWDTPLRFEPTPEYGKGTGGFVGIYDPVNGSGYLERPAAPVTVPAGLEGWSVSGRYGYDVDGTFGMVGSCYYTRVEALPAPEAKADIEASDEPEAPGPGM